MKVLQVSKFLATNNKQYLVAYIVVFRWAIPLVYSVTSNTVFARVISAPAYFAHPNF